MRIATVPAALFVLVASAGPAAAQQFAFDQTIPLADAMRVDASTLGGRIIIRAGSPGEVKVHGTVTVRNAFDTPANAMELAEQLVRKPPIDRMGGVIRLQPPPEPAQRRAVIISYEVALPPNVPITARSNSGEIDAADLSAAAMLETESGKIAVRTAAKDLTVTTGSGAVTVQGAAAALSVRTSSSAIAIRDARGAVDVRTQSGAVNLEVGPAAEVSVETGSSAIVISGARKSLTARSQSGAIRADGRAGGAWNIINSSGRVELTVNQADSATFDLSNRSGTISVPPSLKTSSATKRRVEGTLGAGEHPVTVDSGSGAITLRIVR